MPWYLSVNVDTDMNVDVDMKVNVDVDVHPHPSMQNLNQIHACIVVRMLKVSGLTIFKN
jgi:hypothetical protein